MNRNAYPLQNLFWETTLRCNAGCEFCGSSCGPGRSCEDELTTDEIKAAFREIARHCDIGGTMINVTGGEPLLRDDLFDVMDYASSLGFSWGMVSNGSLIRPDIIRQMKASGMKTLTVSIDGCRETHEKLRKLPGRFDNILSSLRQLAEERFLDHLQVTTVVNRQNISELEDLRQLLLPIGLDSWRVVTVDPIGRAQQNRSLLLNPEDYQRYLDFVTKYRSDQTLPVIKSCSHFFGIREASLRDLPFFCGAGKRVGSILYNGDIFVCPNVERRPELIQGNVRTDPFSEIWQNGFEWFRQTDRSACSSCRSCYYRLQCRGESLHTWDFVSGKPSVCIREWENAGHNPAFSAQEKLYHQTVADFVRSDPHRQALRLCPDRTTGSRIILTKKASQELIQFFSWGESTERNRQEQMACLIGKQEGTLFVVEAVREASLSYADESCAYFTGATLRSAFQALDAFHRSGQAGELIGFIHSHPQELETTLSTGDTDLHRLLLKDYGIALSLLINPQKKRLLAYCGEDMSLGEIFLFGITS